MTTDSELEAQRLAREIFRVLEAIDFLDPSRVCLVLDPPLDHTFELVVAALPRATEKEYRSRIVDNTDWQLLWNPAEFPRYGEEVLSLNLPSLPPDELRAAPEDAFDLLEAERIVAAACSEVNIRMTHTGCFVFTCNSELSNLPRLLQRIKGVPESVRAELPDWIKQDHE